MLHSTTPTERTLNEWKTLDQEAQRANLHPATLRRAIYKGELRHARVGGRKAIRLRAEWTDEWLLRTSTPVEVPSR